MSRAEEAAKRRAEDAARREVAATQRAQEAERRWSRVVQCVADWYAEHGHARVPKSYVTDDGIRLGQILEVERRAYRAGTLDPKHKAALDAFEFEWEGLRKTPRQHYLAALRELRQGGRLDDASVRWLGVLRREGQLSVAQVATLEAAGHSFDRRARRWDDNLAAARAWVREHRRLPTRAVRAGDLAIGIWWSHAVLDERHGRLSDARAADVAALRALAAEMAAADVEVGE